MPPLRHLAMVLVLSLATPASLAAQSNVGIHLFGVSYHYQSRTYVDSTGVVRRYEQFNPGIGGEYVLRRTERLVITAEGGAYKDSKAATNVFLGPAVRVRAGAHLLLGGGVVVMTSHTYGTPVAPLPLLTGQWGRVGVNATWIPALDRRESGALGLFSTLHL